MSQCFKCCNSIVRRFFEHPHEEVECLRVQFFILIAFESYVACSVLRQNLVVGLSWECTDAQKQDMEDQAKTKYVTDGIVLSLHILNIDNLWSHISWGTTTNEEIFFSLSELCQAKISNNTFPSTFSSEDEVFRLEITMHNSFGMHLFQSLKNRIDDQLYFRRFEFVFCLDLIIQLPSFQKLDNYIKRVL